MHEDPRAACRLFSLRRLYPTWTLTTTTYVEELEAETQRRRVVCSSSTRMLYRRKHDVYFVPELRPTEQTTNATHSVGNSHSGRFRKPFHGSVITLADPISPTADLWEVCVTIRAEAADDCAGKRHVLWIRGRVESWTEEQEKTSNVNMESRTVESFQCQIRLIRLVNTWALGCSLRASSEIQNGVAIV
jgi:hypothetical protein